MLFFIDRRSEPSSLRLDVTIPMAAVSCSESNRDTLSWLKFTAAGADPDPSPPRSDDRADDSCLAISDKTAMVDGSSTVPIRDPDEGDGTDGGGVPVPVPPVPAAADMTLLRCSFLSVATDDIAAVRRSLALQ